jgi:DNA-binding response OmpR family regulator
VKFKTPKGRGELVSTIYIVEDDNKSRRLLRDVLGYHGFQVRDFETGEAALVAMAVAGDQPPQLVLLDIQLPGINGFEVLAAIRAELAWAATRVVAVTASVMDHDRKRIRDAGFDEYLPKPVDLDALLAMVTRQIKP